MRKRLNDGNTKNIEITVSLKYLSNYLRTLELPLTNSEINLLLIWSKNCVSTSSTDTGTLAITYTKRDAPQQLNSTQHLNPQLPGTNIHQKFLRKHKTNI